MVIATKKSKEIPMASEDEIEKVIAKGGKTTQESIAQDEDKELKFTLRIPASLMNLVDEAREKEIGNVSRNTWILRAVTKSAKSK